MKSEENFIDLPKISTPKKTIVIGMWLYIFELLLDFGFILFSFLPIYPKQDGKIFIKSETLLSGLVFFSVYKK